MVSNIKREVECFFDSLSVERKTFGVSLSEVLKAELLFVEKRRERIVGVAGIRRGYFFVVVGKDYQDQKIGQKLVRRVVGEAFRRGYSHVVLNVLQSNVKAVHVFQKVGFEKLFASSIRGRRHFFMFLSLNWRGVIWRNLTLIIGKIGLPLRILKLLSMIASLRASVR